MSTDGLTNSDILSMLATIPEPCSIALGEPTNIVNMGLVESITISRSSVTVELCLTDTACVHYPAMKHYIAETLRALGGVTQTQVTITTDVLWTPDRRQTDANDHLIASQC